MPKKTIVLITGKAGMGKSHYAKAIKESYDQRGDKALITSFATPLKNALGPACWEMFKRGIRELTQKQKEIFRPTMQSYGQAGRKISQNYWVDKTKKIILETNADLFIIDDCRFPNELKAFDDYSVIKIRIDKKSANENVNQDISETALDNLPDKYFDILIRQENVEQQVIKTIRELIYNGGL